MKGEKLISAMLIPTNFQNQTPEILTLILIGGILLAEKVIGRKQAMNMLIVDTLLNQVGSWLTNM